MNTFQSLRAVLVLAMFTLMLAACGSGPAVPSNAAGGAATTAPDAVGAAATTAPNTEGNAATTAPVDETAATEPVAEAMPEEATAIAQAGTGSTKLQVTVWLGQQELEAMVKLAERFTQKHPDVQVEFINIIEGGPFGRDKVQQMVAGGVPPDIFMLNSGQFESFASRGVLAPLDELVAGDSFDLGVYWPGAVVGSKFDGKLYGLPKDISNHVVFLNKDLFEEAGVPLPTNDWTWNDYRDLAKKLTKDTDGDGKIDQWGTSILNGPAWWGGFVWPNGGEILSEDRKECKLTMPESVEALKFYFGLLTEDEVSVPPGAMPQTPWQGDQFMSGVIGFSTFGPWFRPGLVENKPFDWTIRLYPKPPDGGEQISMLYTDQWGMSATSDHPKEAWELLKFLGGPEGHTAWSEIYGSRSITPIKELALGDKWLSYGGPEHRADNQTILDQLDATRPPPVDFANANAVDNTWNEQFELVMIEQQTVEQAVQNICDTITPLLQQP